MAVDQDAFRQTSCGTYCLLCCGMMKARSSDLRVDAKRKFARSFVGNLNLSGADVAYYAVYLSSKRRNIVDSCVSAGTGATASRPLSVHHKIMVSSIGTPRRQLTARVRKQTPIQVVPCKLHVTTAHAPAYENLGCPVGISCGLPKAYVCDLWGSREEVFPNAMTCHALS